MAADDLCFEAPLKIVEYPDPRLRAKNKRINTFDENLIKLAEEMFDVMYKTDGIGLSAPQVGMNIQLMVFNPAGERGEGEEIVLVNPVVHKASKETLIYNEGCLSFPRIYADVEVIICFFNFFAQQRPTSVKIEARDAKGAKFRVNLSGLPARVFQHEFDHLQGTLFFDRMTEEVLDSIRAELQLLGDDTIPLGFGLFFLSSAKISWSILLEFRGLQCPVMHCYYGMDSPDFTSLHPRLESPGTASGLQSPGCVSDDWGRRLQYVVPTVTGPAELLRLVQSFVFLRWDASGEVNWSFQLQKAYPSALL
ncbi:Peptide deformylase 1B, chloroplastic [Apostasia shenzhenica]|uniref:Peptide deformylase n=1 Tax=Apostasia shenzhenica TaxID=1088818 RepID=A0A2I0APZ3_9ASPA|nr:Peptide deformylase 1B, chloroplastic [Apostasia shenzhenica]